MTSAKKEELLVVLNSVQDVDPSLVYILRYLLKEVHPVDNTKPQLCKACGCVSYYDNKTKKHICGKCNTIQEVEI